MESQKIAKVRKKFLKRMKANESLEKARIHPNDVTRVKTQDCWIQRFLEHNESDISAAVEMLWWTCEWRNKFGVNEIHENNVNREYLEDGSCFSYGKDRDGKPLFIVTYKMHRKAIRNTTDMQRCLVYWLERLERQGNGDKISLLLDMSGAGLPNVDMDMTKLLINACTVFYPNFINYILVLEASFLLFPTLKIIKDWLPESVLPRFKQIKKSGLKEFVDPAVALKSWGGTNPHVFRFISDNFHPAKTDDTNKNRSDDDLGVKFSPSSLENGKSTTNQVTSVSNKHKIVGEDGNNNTSPPVKRQKLNCPGDKSQKPSKSKSQTNSQDSIDKSTSPCRNIVDKSLEIDLESPDITIVDEFEVAMKQERPESPIEALEAPQWTGETHQAVKSPKKSKKASREVAERGKTPESTSTEHQKRIKKPSWKVLEALKDAEASRIMKKAEKTVRRALKNNAEASKKDRQVSKLGKTVKKILDDRSALEKPATDSLEFADAHDEIAHCPSNPPVNTLTLNYSACIQVKRGRKKNPDGPRLIIENKAEKIAATLKKETNDNSVKTKKPETKLTPEQILKLARMEIKLPHEVPPQHKIEGHAGTISLTKEQRKRFLCYADLKRGPFSETEDEIIHDNWQEFCEIHDWDQNLRYPFLQIKHKGFYYLQSIKNRLKFVQFLAQDLPNRTLYSVYHRFRNLWSTYKEGRYTPDEDDYIIRLMADSDASGSNRRDKKYSIASKKLNRTRQSVWRRWMILKKEIEHDNRPRFCYST